MCAGIARFLGLSATLIRVLMIISAFMGFFVPAAVFYGVLMYFLESAPTEEAINHSQAPIKSRLDQAEATLKQSEQRLRDLERYLTSDTFNVERQFKNL